MKKKILDLIEALVVVAFGCAALYFAFDNDRLRDIIDRQDKLITRSSKNDTAFIKKAENYKDSIKTYTEKISFILNGKEINSDQFINVYNQVKTERDSLKYLFDYAKDLYGFNVFIVPSETSWILRNTRTKADSASMLYGVFKNNLKMNKDGTWFVDTRAKPNKKENTKPIDAPKIDSLKSDSIKN